MELHCLGTSGYHPNETRHTSCYALPDIPLFLDAGTGFYRVESLLGQPEYSHVDSIHILLSHAHLDHVVGLTFVYSLYHRLPLSNIHVHAQACTIRAVQEHLFDQQLFPVMPPLQWHALESSGPEFRIGESTIEWFCLPHPGGSTGYRIQFRDKSFAYVTDTTSYPTSPYWERIQGVDWLLHECNFSDESKSFAIETGHSWLSSVIEGATRANVKNLVLTHFHPTSLPAEIHESPPQSICDSSLELTSLRESGQSALPEQIIYATDQLTLHI